ncbi:MAG: hypothetical protein P4L53_09590 [Candidatus Obscuribacterales bacterium]|nr:hypothetical protein [Candidatus Obscuribacterales bacterium]
MNTIRFTYAPTDAASSGSFLSDNLHGETLISFPKDESVDFCLVSNRHLELLTEGAPFLTSWLHFPPTAGNKEFHYTFSAKWSESFLDSGNTAAILTIEDPLDRDSCHVVRFRVGDFDVLSHDRTVDLSHLLADVSQARIARPTKVFTAGPLFADAETANAFREVLLDDIVANGGIDASTYRELLNIGSHGESPRDLFNRFLTTT